MARRVGPIALMFQRAVEIALQGHIDRRQRGQHELQTRARGVSGHRLAHPTGDESRAIGDGVEQSGVIVPSGRAIYIVGPGQYLPRRWLAVGDGEDNVTPEPAEVPIDVVAVVCGEGHLVYVRHDRMLDGLFHLITLVDWQDLLPTGPP